MVGIEYGEGYIKNTLNFCYKGYNKEKIYIGEMLDKTIVNGDFV